MGFVENLKEKAAKNKQRIVLPEGYEERTLRAADQVLAEGFADIILLDSEENVKANAEKFGLKNLGKAKVVDPKNNAKKAEYANLLFELRKNKGMTLEQAEKLAENNLYLGGALPTMGFIISCSLGNIWCMTRLPPRRAA